ncbi:hypothetical protein [Streptomyces abyssomicinicus]|uniref:hypothetical protein n=1 Tax=Streptomyces abyssomicinicus TaxID=574929 RepID=UPI00124FF0D9|nr:hypothetical protein [Streptomyces abyssomicinicus]
MADETWEALRGTPPSEVRRRVAAVSETLGPRFVRELRGAQRYEFNQGIGQWVVWYFTPDRQVLLLTYEGLADTTPSSDDYPTMEMFYRDVPDDLVALVRNDDEVSTTVINKESGETLHWASSVFWCDGSTWWISEGFLDFCEEEGYDPLVSSCFQDPLFPYAFGRELTAESVARLSADEDDEWFGDVVAEVRERLRRQY